MKQKHREHDAISLAHEVPSHLGEEGDFWWSTEEPAQQSQEAISADAPESTTTDLRDCDPYLTWWMTHWGVLHIA